MPKVTLTVGDGGVEQLADVTKREKLVVEPSEFQVCGIMAEELLSK